MRKSDIVVLGGSAAGITAAITARRHYPERSILLVRKEQRVPIPCGIPYVFGTLGSPEKNLIPDSVLENNGVDLLIAEATRIDRKQRRLQTTESEIEYERLILATGSHPTRPPIAGVELQGVFAITKNLEHLVQIQREIEKAKEVVIIGGGFIGIEFADEINKCNVDKVTIIELADNCLSLSYDKEFCEEMERLLESRGIEIKTSRKVEQIVGNGRVSGVQFEDDSVQPADLVILGIGAKSNVTLAQEANLSIGQTGGIRVDRTMQTSDCSIFACGDCAEKISFFGGRPSPLRLASIAQQEARIAGANLYGIRRENIGTIGVWSTAVGEMAMGTAGLTESMAKQLGYQVVSAEIEGPNRHPGSMNGTVKTKVKLVFEKHSQVILGGQIRGGDTVGEMINIVAACVQKKMTVEDVSTFQMGTHPALTASPIAYPLVNAAESAICQMQ